MDKSKLTIEEEQIRECLSCTKPREECFGTCGGFGSNTPHRKSPEEITELIKRYYPACETWVDLAERTRINKKTLKRYCAELGLKPLVTLDRTNPNFGKRRYRT